MQIQHDFNGVSLSRLAELTPSQVYELLPTFRGECPCCGGKECAEHLAVYWRTVTVWDGSEAEFLKIPVVRFLCNNLGPRSAASATFSVLPADVLPRRRWTLSMLTQVSRWAQKSAKAAMDKLSEVGITIESRSLSRMTSLLRAVYERLRSQPVAGFRLVTTTSRKEQVRSVRGKLEGERGPPFVLAWQERWGQPLLDVNMSLRV